MNARVYNRIELTVRTFKFSFPSISYHQFGASQSKNFMANSKPRKQACKANKTPVINCVKVVDVDVDVEDKNKAKQNSNGRVCEELIPRSHC